MFNIHTLQYDKTITHVLSGRIDSSNANQFEEAIEKCDYKTIQKIIFDCTDLEFISSAGLRVFLKLKKQIPALTKIEVIHVSQAVNEVFELTGFDGIFDSIQCADHISSNIKAVFFDVDGTLFSHQNKEIPQSTIQALAKLRDNGIKTVICSGRMLNELELLPVSKIPFDGYLTLNGNICLDEKKQMFAGHNISPEEVEILVRIFQASRIPFVLIGEKNRYINYVDDIVIDTQTSTQGTIPDIGEYQGEKIYQCLAFVKDKERTTLSELLDECIITSWNETGIDIISKHGGKAKGMEAYMDHYGITRSETMAFGDGENDLEMIRFAGIGVAMGNAVKSLKDIADYVTTDIDEDGIENALKHFNLI